METYTILIVLFSAIILALYVFWFIRFIRKGKRNAETIQQKHDLIVGEASPYTIARAVGEYNSKYQIDSDQFEVIIKYIRK